MRQTFRCTVSHEYWYTLYNCITAYSEPSWRRPPYNRAPGFESDDDYGYGVGNGFGSLDGGELDGSAWHGRSGGSDELAASSMPMTSEESRRTERLFLCAGCVGGFEGPLHGVRL